MAWEKKPTITILCISHLEWTDTLFQRPQQVMLRLSRTHKVIYYKEWAFKEWVRGKANSSKIGATWSNMNANLTVCDFVMPLPRFRNRLKIFEDIGHWLVFRQLQPLLEEKPNSRLILWYYFPIFFELATLLEPDLVIYECMDNYVALSQGTPGSILALLKKREAKLLERADVVFYGSRTLMDERPVHRHKSHHFPTGVDMEHFAQAMKRQTLLPADIKGLKRPILGYWGAVDQRIDYAVLDNCARQRPDWSIVLIGPMVTISERDIAQFLALPNVHWLGPKTYQDLPVYARAFDICMLPFKTTDEGKYLNPTKTLEYLATGKPVISTKIPEVERFYSDTVMVAQSAFDFVRKSEIILAREHDPLEKEKRMAKARGHSWDAMAEQMEGIANAELGGVDSTRFRP
jgi:glycosyltransferase involved in cell wall biosynthesis